MQEKILNFWLLETVKYIWIDISDILLILFINKSISKPTYKR